VVLRPSNPQQAFRAITALAALGVRHVELAWRAEPAWVGECRELIHCFPALRLGAASLCGVAALEDARRAGFSYAVSPVLDRELVERAGQDLVLVPGVMTPTEVHRARSWGCGLVKLFPAAPLGAGYWRRLTAPLGLPLPFCIAAGGLAVGDVLPWLEAGVDAVALGSSLTVSEAGEVAGDGPLRSLVETLTARSF
jgi:2-dehydro-3-deoxyphosphogluconate aldolase/(4S)-4-hydroxy-2-oxoglutarate aldolase